MHIHLFYKFKLITSFVIYGFDQMIQSHLHTDVVLRTMRIVEPADRIPSPISRGCDLPMVTFLPQLKELRFWGMSAG